MSPSHGKSTNPEYISYDGVITQLPHEEGDQTVTITATIKLNDIEKKKTFTVRYWPFLR